MATRSTPVPAPEPICSDSTPLAESVAARKASESKSVAPDLSPKPMAVPLVCDWMLIRFRSASNAPAANAKLLVAKARLYLLPATEPLEVKLTPGALMELLAAKVNLPANSTGEVEVKTPERVISVKMVLPPVPALSVSR